jgi:hypothetical protein
MIGKGLDAYVAVDASGTFSETKRPVGLLRMLQAGVILSDYATLMVEMLRDNARPEAAAVYGAIDMRCVKLVGADRAGLRQVVGVPVAGSLRLRVTRCKASSPHVTSCCINKPVARINRQRHVRRLV